MFTTGKAKNKKTIRLSLEDRGDGLVWLYGLDKGDHASWIIAEFRPNGMFYRPGSIGSHALKTDEHGRIKEFS